MLFFAVLRGNTPGRVEKNEPKTPDAFDVGPDGVNLGLQVGSGLRAAREIRGAGGDVGCRISEIQFFGKRTLVRRPVDGKNR
jgi:hypothetical protein